jgi:hypothetical protein
MTWPTLDQVNAADGDQLRAWLNDLPGAEDADQLTAIRLICARIVATWSPMAKHLPATSINALAELPRPKLPIKRPAKPKPEPAGIDLFKSTFSRP